MCISFICQQKDYKEHIIHENTLEIA
uniref:Uncharacterized protein n=1 Tax=Arundo donax TaxID=35708 RepID=A0A0A9BKJ7_ARUDO